MSIYSDNLAHAQVVINCPYFIAQMCTCEDTLAHYLGMSYFDKFKPGLIKTVEFEHPILGAKFLRR